MLVQNLLKNRVLNFSGSWNLRELGGYQTEDGYQIRWRKLLRSGNLSNLTLLGQEELVSYGLKYDLDFRSKSEVSHFPDPEMPGVRYEHLPVYPKGGLEISPWRNVESLLKHHKKFQPASEIGRVYQNVVLNNSGQTAYAKMFRLMLENSQTDCSLLFHCSAGQDRTGIGAVLIEKLFKVPDQLIIKDYLLSNLSYINRAEEVITNAVVDDYINQMNLSDVVAQSITEMFRAIDYFYGSFESYVIHALKLSKGDINDLRNIYLTISAS